MAALLEDMFNAALNDGWSIMVYNEGTECWHESLSVSGTMCLLIKAFNSLAAIGKTRDESEVSLYFGPDGIVGDTPYLQTVVIGITDSKFSVKSIDGKYVKMWHDKYLDGGSTIFTYSSTAKTW